MNKKELQAKILSWRIEKQKELGLGQPTQISLTQKQWDCLGGHSMIYGMFIKLRSTTT